MARTLQQEQGQGQSFSVLPGAKGPSAARACKVCRRDAGTDMPSAAQLGQDLQKSDHAAAYSQSWVQGGQRVSPAGLHGCLVGAALAPPPLLMRAPAAARPPLSGPLLVAALSCQQHVHQAQPAGTWLGGLTHRAAGRALCCRKLGQSQAASLRSSNRVLCEPMVALAHRTKSVARTRLMQPMKSEMPTIT